MKDGDVDTLVDKILDIRTSMNAVTFQAQASNGHSYIARFPSTLCMTC